MREPAGDQRHRRVPLWAGQRCQRERQRSGSDAPQRRSTERSRRPPVGGGGGLASGVRQAVEGPALRVRDYEPGRHPTSDERPDHRSGRSPNDVISASRIPAGLQCDRMQRAGQPGAPRTPPAPSTRPILGGSLTLCATRCAVAGSTAIFLLVPSFAAGRDGATESQPKQGAASVRTGQRVAADTTL